MPTFSDGFEVVSVVGFADAAPIHFRRNIAAKLDAIEILSPVGFADPVVHYKRNRAAALNTIEVIPDMGFSDLVTRIPPVFKAPRSYPATLLVSVVVKAYSETTDVLTKTRIDTVTKLPVSTTLTFTAGNEIVYKIPNKLKEAPRLIAPFNGSFDRIGSPIMRWTGTAEAAYYEVHVARDIDFTDRVARFDVVGNELQRGFYFGQSYYWRVRAVAGDAVSDYSQVWKFTVFAANPLQDFAHLAEGKGRLLNQFKESTT